MKISILQILEKSNNENIISNIKSSFGSIAKLTKHQLLVISKYSKIYKYTSLLNVLYENKNWNKNYWIKISKIENLPDEFMSVFKYQLCWSELIKYNTLSLSQIRKYILFLNIENVIKYVPLTNAGKDFLISHNEKLIKPIIKYQELDDIFVVKYRGLIVKYNLIYCILESKNLLEFGIKYFAEELKKYSFKSEFSIIARILDRFRYNIEYNDIKNFNLTHDEIIHSKNIPDEVIEGIIEKQTVDWILIGLIRHHTLSDKIIDKLLSTKRLMTEIYIHQRPTTEFFNEYKEYINPYIITTSQIPYPVRFNVIDVLLANHDKKISINQFLIFNNSFAIDDLAWIINSFKINTRGWEIISKFQNLSYEFIRKHKTNLSMGYIQTNQYISNETKLKLNLYPCTICNDFICRENTGVLYNNLIYDNLSDKSISISEAMKIIRHRYNVITTPNEKKEAVENRRVFVSNLNKAYKQHSKFLK